MGIPFLYSLLVPVTDFPENPISLKRWVLIFLLVALLFCKKKSDTTGVEVRIHSTMDIQIEKVEIAPPAGNVIFDVQNPGASMDGRLFAALPTPRGFLVKINGKNL